MYLTNISMPSRGNGINLTNDMHRHHSNVTSWPDLDALADTTVKSSSNVRSASELEALRLGLWQQRLQDFQSASSTSHGAHLFCSDRRNLAASAALTSASAATTTLPDQHLVLLNSMQLRGTLPLLLHQQQQQQQQSRPPMCIQQHEISSQVAQYLQDQAVLANMRQRFDSSSTPQVSDRGASGIHRAAVAAGPRLWGALPGGFSHPLESLTVPVDSGSCMQSDLMPQERIKRPLDTMLGLLASTATETGPLSDTANTGPEHSTALVAHRSTTSTFPSLLYYSTDPLKLSKLQVLLRQQIEAFQATEADVSTHVRGRNKSIRVGQVGIRCRHCAKEPAMLRSKGSTYFPTSIWGFYQASQNMCLMHLHHGACHVLPQTIQAEFVQLVATKQERKGCNSGAGRAYWASTAHAMGLVDMQDGVYVKGAIPSGVQPPVQTDGNTENPGVYRVPPKKIKLTAAVNNS
jgi:hypothetical protein